MAKKLNIDDFSDKCRFAKIGKLKNEVIGFLKENSNSPLLDKLHECDILLWHNRIEYTEKHKGNFKTAEEYYMCIEDIPDIIENPDYIGLPPHDESIQYIKVYNNIIIVAVRISTTGSISYRTLYPITESQLKDYLRKNRAWKFNTIIDNV